VEEKMKIGTSKIHMESEHSLQKKETKEERLRVWTVDSDIELTGESISRRAVQKAVDKVTLSKMAMEQELRSQTASTEGSLAGLSDKDPHLLTMKLILEGLSGHKIHFPDLKPLTLAPETRLPSASMDPGLNNDTMETDLANWGLEYDYSYTLHEQEEMSYRANGMVVTEDGSEIEFSLDLQMSREFYQSTNLSIRAGDAELIDPLVVNFAGSAIELTDQKFSFDLDADGIEEELSFVGQGSGFLVFDRNDDGVINNGKEMFGPQTGQGFTELEKYDLDKNGWIDENDPIYEKLQIWSKDVAGSDYLATLKEKNIGAILLENSSTQFSYKDQQNNLKGVAKSSSIFLSEEGKAGLIQEIDLAA
jgi:hypothetical protein